MVKIRLRRIGAKKRPFYRLVVADSRSPRDGRFIENLGTYDPLTTPAKVEIDAEKVRAWLVKGARPSDSARSLLQQQGILPRPPMVVYPAKVVEAAPEPVIAAPAAVEPEAAAPEVVEAETVETSEAAETPETEPTAVADEAPKAEAEPVANTSES